MLKIINIEKKTRERKDEEKNKKTAKDKTQKQKTKNIFIIYCLIYIVY